MEIELKPDETMRLCKCGTILEPYQTKYCSKECHLKDKRKSKPVKKKKETHPPKWICIDCGQEYQLDFFPTQNRILFEQFVSEHICQK